MTGKVCFLYYYVFSSVLCFQRASTPCGGLHLQTQHPRLKDGKLKVTPVCGAKFETACPPSLHKTVSKEREGEEGRGREEKGGEGRSLPILPSSRPAQQKTWRGRGGRGR